MIQNVHYQTFLFVDGVRPLVRCRLAGHSAPPRGFAARRVPMLPRMHRLRLAGCLVLAALGASLPACRSTAADVGSRPRPARRAYTPDLPVSVAPFREVHANFKERLEQPYVFVELRGSYTQTGRSLSGLADALNAAGLDASGAPFALFYDDPGTTPVAALRSRACIPVEHEPPASAGLAYDVLPRAQVVYAVIGGPYPEVPRAYPGIYAYLKHMGWVEAGPIREVYLVAPGSVASYAELLCEVQIPAAAAP